MLNLLYCPIVGGLFFLVCQQIVKIKVVEFISFLSAPLLLLMSLLSEATFKLFENYKI